MSALDHLTILDLSAQIDALPKHKGYQVLPPRGPEAFITFHYSGVFYADRSRSAEQKRILDEAAYQLHHNYGSIKAPAYPDGLLYDFVVLSDGTIVRTRNHRQQLWHCANVLGNAQSWSTHVMLGPGQDLTPPQKASLFALWDALRADSGSRIPRSHVVAHCEWPMRNGVALPITRYAPQAGQSQCPGPILFGHVVMYRAQSDSRTYRVTTTTPIYEGPGLSFPVALQGTARLATGEVVQIDQVQAGWAHLSAGNVFRDLGFVPASAVESV